MAIDFKKFADWAVQRFPDVKITDNEIKIHSIFTDDTKHKLWCNPSGGKKELKYGAYHCWKTNKGGSLVSFVMLVDKCSREEALQVLCGYKTMSQLEKELNDFLSEAEIPSNYDVTKEGDVKFTLPSGSYLISELGVNNWYREKAESYLTQRKIPIDGLYVCMEEPYKGRIVIPYYNKLNQLIYWNTRHLNPKAKIRYLGPPKTCGIGKEDVIYMAGNWMPQGSLLYVCEGEFNAISLKLSELDACACGGKNMSEKQAIILSDYKIVVCLDRDKAGTQGTIKMLNMLSMSKNLNAKDKLFFVRPPDIYNDWNEMYVDAGPVVLNNWIKNKTKPVDFSAPHGMVGDVVQLS